ncbi:MAG TPA: DinB family protein [Blastocatellia bacterium]|nr:DinB family protein [Blastocatellia bacterium]
MNPYSKWIEGKDPLAVLAATPGRIRELVSRFGPDGMNRPYAPGKWTARQVIAHLAQCEMIFGTRFRQAVTLEGYVVQPFDQDEWMAREPVAADGGELDALLAMREWNLAFWRSLSTEELGRKLTHPERGEMTVNLLLETVAGHDLNHLEQLETAAAGK